MARIRSVKPELWDDRKLARAVSRDGRLLYIALWNFADEHGRCNGDPEWLRGHIFPYDTDLSAASVAGLLDELAAARRVTRYVVAGDPYLFLPKLADHQRLEPGKSQSRLPAPDEDQSEAADNPPGKSARDSDPPGRESLLYVAGCRLQGAGSRGPREARIDPDTFGGFWAAYPTHVGKRTAEKAWTKALRRAKPGEIIAAARRFADDPNREPEFTAHPTTWLNRDGWHDDPPPPRSRGRPTPTENVIGWMTEGTEHVDETGDMQAIEGGL